MGSSIIENSQNEVVRIILYVAMLHFVYGVRINHVRIHSNHIIVNHFSSE